MDSDKTRPPAGNHDVPDRGTMEREYTERELFHEKILRDFERDLHGRIRPHPIHYSIKCRVKSFESYYGKFLDRLRGTGNPATSRDITDILGLRVVCPFQENLGTIEGIIKKSYAVIETENKGRRHSFNEFGYSSVHLLVEIPRHIRETHGAGDLVCEIQLCTTLQDAWSEVEHELVYKKEFSPFDGPMKRKLAALNANLTLSDILFQEILDYHRNLRDRLRERRLKFFEKVDQASGVDFTGREEAAPSVHAEPAGEDSVRPDLSLDELLMEALEAHNDNRIRRAIAIYDRILSSGQADPIRSAILLHRGMAYFAESNYDRSIDDFSAAIELEGDSYRALFYRGTVNRVLQEYHSALEDFNRCVEIDPYDFNPRFARAQVYYQMQDYPEALACCEETLKINPKSEKALKFREIVRSAINLYGG